MAIDTPDFNMCTYTNLGLSPIATLPVPPRGSTSIELIPRRTRDGDFRAANRDKWPSPLLISKRNLAIEDDLCARSQAGQVECFARGNCQVADGDCGAALFGCVDVSETGDGAGGTTLQEAGLDWGGVDGGELQDHGEEGSGDTHV